ncbi:MAG: MauE/DoxX family redox-associated membrane protein [Pseudomonadales bacterium]
MSLLAILADSAAVFLMVVLLLAGVHKISPANQNYYRGVLEGYGLAYHSQLNLISLVLGVVEVFTALAILIPASRPLGAALAIALFTIYFAAMAAQLLQGKRDLDCGCAGPLGSSTISAALLLRNAVLIALATFCLLGPGSLLIQASTAALTLPFALLALIVYACAEQLIANSQKLKLLQNRGH